MLLAVYAAGYAALTGAEVGARAGACIRAVGGREAAGSAMMRGSGPGSCCSRCSGISASSNPKAKITRLKLPLPSGLDKPTMPGARSLKTWPIFPVLIGIQPEKYRKLSVVRLIQTIRFTSTRYTAVSGRFIVSTPPAMAFFQTLSPKFDCSIRTNLSLCISSSMTE